MKGFTVALTLFVVALTVCDVLGQEEHGHRTKRSPDGGLVPALLLGKSFLLGSLLGPKIFNKGWGGPIVRHGGWGWAPRRSAGWSSGWSSGWAPGSGGYASGWGSPVASGWGAPVSHGWSSAPVVVNHGWGW